MNDPSACGAFPYIPFVIKDIEPVNLVLSSPCEAAEKQCRPHEVGYELERVAVQAEGHGLLGHRSWICNERR
uniref:Uncharacterized protein n=1 Tax=Cucumis melo TaxID=3656 RepID=A0A9I9E4P7_CUCME